MKIEIEIPLYPEPGFYYHYKHNVHGSLNTYAYEVLGVGRHTETEELFVVYRSLYPEASVFLQGGLFDIRPLSMFMEKVGDTPRFRKIINSEVVEKLKGIRDYMYPQTASK